MGGCLEDACRYGVKGLSACQLDHKPEVLGKGKGGGGILDDDAVLSLGVAEILGVGHEKICQICGAGALEHGQVNGVRVFLGVFDQSYKIGLFITAVLVFAEHEMGVRILSAYRIHAGRRTEILRKEPAESIGVLAPGVDQRQAGCAHGGYQMRCLGCGKFDSASLHEACQIRGDLRQGVVQIDVSGGVVHVYLFLHRRVCGVNHGVEFLYEQLFNGVEFLFHGILEMSCFSHVSLCLLILVTFLFSAMIYDEQCDSACQGQATADIPDRQERT